MTECSTTRAMKQFRQFIVRKLFGRRGASGTNRPFEAMRKFVRCRRESGLATDLSPRLPSNHEERRCPATTSH